RQFPARLQGRLGWLGEVLEVAGDLEPLVLAALVDGIFWLSEKGVVERAERDGDQAVELAVDQIINVRPAVGAEVEGGGIAAIARLDEGLGLSLDLHLIAGPAGLGGKGAS